MANGKGGEERRGKSYGMGSTVLRFSCRADQGLGVMGFFNSGRPEWCHPPVFAFSSGAQGKTAGTVRVRTEDRLDRVRGTEPGKRLRLGWPFHLLLVSRDARGKTVACNIYVWHDLIGSYWLKGDSFRARIGWIFYWFHGFVLPPLSSPSSFCFPGGLLFSSDSLRREAAPPSPAAARLSAKVHRSVRTTAMTERRRTLSEGWDLSCTVAGLVGCRGSRNSTPLTCFSARGSCSWSPMFSQTPIFISYSSLVG